MSDIKNYPSFNLRKEGVQVEVLKWLGDLKPYGELQDVWVQINGIPPRYCHWKVFAQIASGFGLMTEVDWATLFKSFYETVRIKVACKDYTKIPAERLFEMGKKLHLVNFVEAGQEKVLEDSKGDGGDDGGNDDLGDDGEEDDLLDDVQPPPQSQPQDPSASNKSGTKTPTTKQSTSTGHKIAQLGGPVINHEDQEICLQVLMKKGPLLTKLPVMQEESMQSVSGAFKSHLSPELVVENQPSVETSPNLKLTSVVNMSNCDQGEQSSMMYGQFSQSMTASGNVGKNVEVEKALREVQGTPKAVQGNMMEGW